VIAIAMAGSGLVADMAVGAYVTWNGVDLSFSTLTIPVLNVTLVFEITDGIINTTGYNTFDGYLIEDTVMFDADVTIILLNGSLITYQYDFETYILSGSVSGSGTVAGELIDLFEMNIPNDIVSIQDYVIHIHDSTIAVELNQFIQNAPGGITVSELDIELANLVSYCFQITASAGDSPLSVITQYLDSNILSLCGYFNASTPGTGFIEYIVFPEGIALVNVTYVFDTVGGLMDGTLQLPHPLLSEVIDMQCVGYFTNFSIYLEAVQIDPLEVAVANLFNTSFGINLGTIRDVVVDLLVETENYFTGTLTAILDWQSVCWNLYLDITPDTPNGFAELCDDDETPTLNDFGNDYPPLRLSYARIEFIGLNSYLNATIDFSQNSALQRLADFAGISLQIPIYAKLETGIVDASSLLLRLDQITSGSFWDDVVDSNCTVDLSVKIPTADCILSLALPTFEDKLVIPFKAFLTGADEITFNSTKETLDQTLRSDFFGNLLNLDFQNIDSQWVWTESGPEGYINAEVSKTILGRNFCISFSATIPTTSLDDVDFDDSCPTHSEESESGTNTENSSTSAAVALIFLGAAMI